MNYPRYFFPGEPLAEDELRVTVLGSGGPFRRIAQASASILVELGDGKVFIMDAGSGSAANLNSLQIPQERLNTVFLTHLHCDHWADLTHLYAAHTLFGGSEPFHLWGPSGPEERYGTAAFARAFEQAMAWDIDTRRGRGIRDTGSLEVHEFDYREVAWIFEDDSVRIKAFPALHIFDGPVSYRLEWNGLVFVFSGDTIPNRFFVEHAQGADLMIYDTALPPESTARNGNLPGWLTKDSWRDVHTPARAAGRVFSLTNPKLAVMWHLVLRGDDHGTVVDEVRKNYDGQIAIAEDLMVFSVSHSGTVSRGVAITSPRAEPVVTPMQGDGHGSSNGSVRLHWSAWLADAELTFDDDGSKEDEDTRLQPERVDG